MIRQDLLKTIVADKLVMAIILINTIVLFFGAFPGLHKSYYNVLFPIDYLCTVYFLLELVIKVHLLGWKNYWSSGWNKFDFIIVLISAPMLLSPILNTADFAIVLILRVGRIFRFFRIAKFIPNQEHLWNGIKRALAASVGFLITLCIYNFILAIGAAYLFSDIDPERFGDPLISIYTMFKVFTIEGWYEIPDSIALNSTPLMGFVARAYFIFTVLTGGLIGLSIANAVFVDEMIMDNTDSIEERVKNLEKELNNRFDALSTTNDHIIKIYYKELISYMKNKTINNFYLNRTNLLWAVFYISVTINS
ncbi:MAG: ion transporter [Vampirovibrionia bacterium]